MNNPVEVILFDMGGTLRNSIPKGSAAKIKVVGEMLELLSTELSAQALSDLISERFKQYSLWARKTLEELSERELWTRWILPDWPEEQIAAIAVRLNELWRRATAERIFFPEARDVIVELFRRGYRLGIVSNTVSSVEIPRTLYELKISGYFETVILSCVFGKRKPDPDILLEAVRRLRVSPGSCVYVGNLLHRDVQSAQEAGFARTIIRRAPETFSAHQAEHAEIIADTYIDDLRELLDIFPPLSNQAVARPVYKASLSTMWAINNYLNLSDFFEGARRLGFSEIELNHQVDTSMLSDLDLSNYSISSVHEPCPANISIEELKNRDWLISSPDENHRNRGVQAIKRSIDLAQQFHIPVVVVHCGMVSTDVSTEKELRTLFADGKSGSDEYQALKQKMIAFRKGLITPCFAAVKQSLHELLDYAAPYPVRLGLENRYHYYDIPGLDEMGELLALAGPEQLGFVYDAGHAQALDRLGFFASEAWLHRYVHRLIEIHLHDVVGVNDHYAPGRGEIDFAKIAKYLPKAAIRTLELQTMNSPEQVVAGLEHLAQTGCINPIE